LTIYNSCKNNPVTPNPHSSVGTWNWIISENGGITGGIVTPSTSFTQKLTFTKDKIYMEYWNEKLKLSTPFTIATQSLFNGKPMETIYFPPEALRAPKVISRLDNDTLILIDYSAEGYTSTYNRIN